MSNRMTIIRKQKLKKTNTMGVLNDKQHLTQENVDVAKKRKPKERNRSPNLFLTTRPNNQQQKRELAEKLKECEN